MKRTLAVLSLSIAALLAAAAPTLACGGLIGPNGAVNLLRTSTFAGYHDGEEHYITAFEFAGGGGATLIVQGLDLASVPGLTTEQGRSWAESAQLLGRVANGVLTIEGAL